MIKQNKTIKAKIKQKMKIKLKDQLLIEKFT
jgi:hypothetical protein